MLGMMGYEARIAPYHLAFLKVAGQNHKSYFTPVCLVNHPVNHD
jgi:hypothetical protein